MSYCKLNPCILLLFSEASLAKRKTKKRETDRRRRAALSPEHRADLRYKQRKRMKTLRESYTDDEKTRRRKAAKAAMRTKRETWTDEDRDSDRMKAWIRMQHIRKCIGVLEIVHPSCLNVASFRCG